MLVKKKSILKNKKIVVCVTGSVAAIETPKVVRELRRRGAKVFCVMSKAAQKIIHPYVLEWASENEVVTEITGKIEHVKLCGEVPGKVDLVIVAPSTANTIGKIAFGVDDTPVTTVVTTAFGSKIPIMIVPAMHISMYKHPIVKENIGKLKKHGVDFIMPRIEEGKAKIAGFEKIVNYIELRLTKKDFKGKKVLVTAGATIEDLDAVRVITNKSSGKMGIAIAEEAYRRGADVILIKGKTTVKPVFGFKTIEVRSAEQMFNAVKENIDCDIIIHAAAVSDFTVDKELGKISSKNKINLELTPNTKILEKIKTLNKKVFLVGFKAEYKLTKKQLIERAYKKLKQANCDLIVANDIGREKRGFDVDTNEVFIIDKRKKVKSTGLKTKKEVAKEILDEIK